MTPANREFRMNLALPNELATSRLVLRSWRRADAPTLKMALDGNLEHLQAWLPWAMSEPSPIGVLEERLDLFARQFDTGEQWLFAIWSRSTDALLGGAGLHPRIGEDGLEMGYWLQASATGHGFMTEAADALTKLALRQPGIERVQIRCDPENVASAGVPKRLGYRQLATIPNATIKPSGAARDSMVWEITRAEVFARV
jgi:RimJ/RimL family protein N-acetyltransferase